MDPLLALLLLAADSVFSTQGNGSGGGEDRDLAAAQGIPGELGSRCEARSARNCEEGKGREPQ